MTKLETLKAHFAFLAGSKGYITQADYDAACHSITDTDLLNKLADWLLIKNYTLVKGIGQQYQKEIKTKVKNPSVEDVKDTKHRQHKNKNKFQKSKKKADEEVSDELWEQIRAWMKANYKKYVPERGFDQPKPWHYTPYLSQPPDTLDDYIDSFVDAIAGEFGEEFREAEWVNILAAEMISDALQARADYEEAMEEEYGKRSGPWRYKDSSFHLNKVIEKMQEFEDEFLPAWKKWRASLDNNKDFLEMLASVNLTAQDFSNYEQGQRSIMQLIEAYANQIPEDAYIPNNALQNEFLKIDPDAKLPINQRITTAISKIFDPNILAEIFSEIYKGIQSGFEKTTPSPEMEPTEPSSPQSSPAPLPSGTREIEFTESTGPALETASKKANMVGGFRVCAPLPKLRLVGNLFNAEEMNTTVSKIGYTSKDRMKIQFDNGINFSAFIAETPIQKAAGLEVFDSLAATDGLFFPFEDEGSVTFHMGSVKFPIDIVFLMESPHGMEVGKIVNNIKPGSLDWWSYPKTSAVLELVGGTCKKTRIKVGSTCTISKRIEAQILPPEVEDNGDDGGEDHGAPTEEQYTAKVEQIENQYKPKMMQVLENIRTTLIEAGYNTTEIDEYTDENLRLDFMVYREDIEPTEPNEDDVDISFQVAPSLYFDGSLEGMSFIIDITSVGGRMIGGLSPYNYTSEVWVDINDENAVEERFNMFVQADPSDIVSLIEDFWAKG